MPVRLTQPLRCPLNTKRLGSAVTRLALAPALLLAVTGCSEGQNGTSSGAQDTGIANTVTAADGASPAGAGATTAVTGTDSYTDQWGPAVGSTLPLLAAADQDGKARTLGDLSGKNGLLLFFNRSADW